MKYPRTYHLPFSEGITNDDKVVKNIRCLEGKHVVVTLKMDGENTCICRNTIHARSEDSLDHPSRHWVKGLWAKIHYLLPENMTLYGENLYAKHSIYYTNLESYFYLFSVWEDRYCLPWEEVVETSKKFGLVLVPILYEGPFSEDTVREFTKLKQYDGNEVEGFVVRAVDGFHYNDFSFNIAKYVRKDHVRTDNHWMYGPMIKNKMK